MTKQQVNKLEAGSVFYDDLQPGHRYIVLTRYYDYSEFGKTKFRLCTAEGKSSYLGVFTSDLDEIMLHRYRFSLVVL